MLVAASSLRSQQTQRCEINAARQLNQKLPSGQYNTFFGGPVLVNCPAKELTLRADSLEAYGDESRIFALGHVRYNEPRLTLTSNYLTYYQRDERAVASGDVDAKLANGSTLKGPTAEYLRAIPGTRPVPRMLANGRPTITIVQKDSAGKVTPPTTVLANNITMEGDSLVYAGGAVIVTREEVIARGDSITLDSEKEITVLMRGPSIEGRRDRPFTLSGERIELTSKSRKLDRVMARGKGKAVSEDLTLLSDTIDLRIADNLLQRAIAWGPKPVRARATSPTQQIISDSIDVSMPQQRIREMHAVRLAQAEGRPDSIRFKADTVDWMRGDTIVARFDTAATRDTARTARVKELVAVGHAKSFYHLPAADTTQRRPAINYVTGREIVVAFQDQKVARVTVIDQAAGVYLEPRPASAAASRDTTRAARPARPPR